MMESWNRISSSTALIGIDDLDEANLLVIVHHTQLTIYSNESQILRTSVTTALYDYGKNPLKLLGVQGHRNYSECFIQNMWLKMIYGSLFDGLLFLHLNLQLTQWCGNNLLKLHNQTVIQIEYLRILYFV